MIVFSKQTLQTDQVPVGYLMIFIGSMTKHKTTKHRKAKKHRKDKTSKDKTSKEYIEKHQNNIEKVKKYRTFYLHQFYDTNTFFLYR